MNDIMQIEVDQGWTSIGRIELSDGKLIAPANLPDKPGLYCLVFDGTKRYYGEAGDIQRRIGDYLFYYESTGIESEFRLHQALLSCKGAEIRIVTGDSLSSRSIRCNIESRLVREAKAQGLHVLNGGTILERIAFHASEIKRLAAKLSSSSEATK